MIEQKELYGKVNENGENAGIHADSRFSIPDKPMVKGPEDIVKSFDEAKVSPAVRDVILHGREEALMSIPMNMDRLACWGEVVEAVVEYEVSNGLPPNFNAPYPPPPKIKSSPSTSSPVSSLSPMSFPSPSSGSSPPPLSHVAETSPPYSSPEPTCNSVGSSQLMPSSNLSSELSAAFDIYMPSDTTADTFSNLTNQFMPPHTTASFNTTTTGSNQGAVYHPQLDSPPNPNQYNSSLPVMPSQQQQQQQFSEPITMGTQYNGASVMGSQYNGMGALATQCNSSTMPSTSNSGSFALPQQQQQQHIGSGMQFNGPSAVATQYNGPGMIATQYNSGGSIASQYNSHGVVASQHNGANVMGAQYNGPGVAATQFNSSGAMASQYNNPSAQAHQYNLQSSGSTAQYNGVNIIANQYVGVQPPMHHLHHQTPVDGSIPFSVPAHVNNTPQQMAPVINMNVTITVPPSAMNGGEQKTVPDKLSHHSLPIQFQHPQMPAAVPMTDCMHIGKVEPPLVGQNPNSCLPYSLQGTFEVSQQPSWQPVNRCQGNGGDDILEALQLI